MNPVTNKILQYVGYGFVTFIYGAGVASVVVGGRDLYNTKKRLRELEMDTRELAIAMGNDVKSISTRLDILDSRNSDLCQRMGYLERVQNENACELYDIFKDLEAIKNRYSDDFTAKSDETTAKSDEICTNLEEKIEVDDGKKSSKSAKK